MKDDFLACCAPGTVCEESYVQVTGGVSLRVVSFKPLHESMYPVIVFVPGWISLMSAWREVMRELTAECNVIYIETREKITSRTKRDTRYGVQQLAEDISGVVAKLKGIHKHYVLAGSSLGATVVIESCRILKEKPHGVVLIEPNAEFRVPPLGLFIIKITSPYLYVLIKPVIKWYLRTFRLDIETDYAQYEKYCHSIDAADPWKLKKAAIAFSDYEIWDALPSISMPVLIFGASRDVLHEPENLKKMRLRMDRVTWIDLKTNKRTHSAEMVTHLRRFLAEIGKGART